MKVSVCMIVYNHEKFISEAILGVLNQEVDFEIELLIANDKSTDKTHEIIEAIISKHSSKNHTIRYFNHTENKGMMTNFIDTLKLCTGQYIAFCEGDDYWTDPLKLKKQVAFLEHNLDYNICFHNVKIFNEERNVLEPDAITKKVEATTTAIDLARGNYMHTPSVVIRNNFKLPVWFNESPLGDWVLYMIGIGDKKIMKLEDVMSVYRVHDSSVWSNKTEAFKIKQTIKSHQLVLDSKLFGSKIKKILWKSIKYMNHDIGIETTFFQKLKSKLLYI